MSDKIEVIICLGSSCFSRGNKEQVNEISQFIKSQNLSSKVEFKGTRCFGACENGPSFMIDGELITHATSKQIIDTILTKIQGK